MEYIIRPLAVLKEDNFYLNKWMKNNLQVFLGYAYFPYGGCYCLVDPAGWHTVGLELLAPRNHMDQLIQHGNNGLT